mmetsp:Transcript_157408/g.504906  ORF Transcript_157408/g.504906 Transcript_157408/m.504906 type:complete len:224 (+) Transcript_157408:729-1400(+)
MTPSGGASRKASAMSSAFAPPTILNHCRAGDSTSPAKASTAAQTEAGSPGRARARTKCSNSAGFESGLAAASAVPGSSAKISAKSAATSARCGPRSLLPPPPPSSPPQAAMMRRSKGSLTSSLSPSPSPTMKAVVEPPLLPPRIVRAAHCLCASSTARAPTASPAIARRAAAEASAAVARAPPQRAPSPFLPPAARHNHATCPIKEPRCSRAPNRAPKPRTLS